MFQILRNKNEGAILETFNYFYTQKLTKTSQKQFFNGRGN